MPFYVTNTIAAQCLRGQDAIITVSQAQSNLLLGIYGGARVTITSSGNVGYVSEVDIYGYTLRAKPAKPDGRMDSVTAGILLASELIQIG